MAAIDRAALETAENSTQRAIQSAANAAAIIASIARQNI
jgi:hypothetical protein